MKDLIIVGCGGFGREVHDIVQAINAEMPTWNLLGFVDDGPQDRDAVLVARLGLAVLGTTDYLKEHPGIQYALAIGTGGVRQLIDRRLTEAGSEPATLVHPQATIGADCTIGSGAIVCAGARLTTNVTLGRHVHVNLNSTVGHDARLGDHVTIFPLVAVSGWVSIGAEAMLGTHSCVLPGLTVGESCQVGAGAVVVRDVPDNTTVRGCQHDEDRLCYAVVPSGERHSPAVIADGLAARGHEVHVLTGFPNYPTGSLLNGYEVRPYLRERRSERVTLHRAPLYPSHDRSAARRGLNYLSFAVGASAVGLTRVPTPDAWLVYSSPATAALPAMLRRTRKTPVSLIIQDLWPDSVTGSGLFPSRSRAPIERSLNMFTDATYRSADAIGVISPGMKRVLELRGVTNEKIHYTPNWVSATTPSPSRLPDLVEKSRLGIPTDGPVFLYAGNLGQLQALSGLVDAFARMPSANLVLIGHGVESDRLQDRAKDLKNVHILPPVSADEIGAYQQASDVLVVSLADTPLLRVTMPSKVQASLAAGRPIFVHGAGDVADVVARAQCGVAANPNNPDGVVDAIHALTSRLPTEAEPLGLAARKAFEAEFSESAGLDKLEAMLFATHKGS